LRRWVDPAAGFPARVLAQAASASRTVAVSSSSVTGSVLGLRGRGHGDFQGRGADRFQDPARDMVIQRGAMFWQLLPVP
jgi:hypothetical protein